MAFVELHARSAFSFLRASSSPEALVKRAAELGMEQIALCDRDGVYGSARVYHQAKEQGLRGLVGVELTMEDQSVLPVLVRTREGYQNLCRMMTRSKLRSAKGEGRIKWSELEEYAQGLFALTGDEEGPLAQVLASDDRNAVLPVLEKLIRIFGKENVAVELQRHRLRSDKKRISALLELAERSSLPVIASNGVCYHEKEGRLLLDAFTSLRHHKALDEAGLLLAANSQRYLKSEKEMRDLFADLPQAIDNTARLAERLEFTLENLGYEFPSYAVPAGHDQASFLRELTFRGALDRYTKMTSAIQQQLDHELSLIGKLGFCGYFLIVWDLVKYAKDQGILVQGRGSAANSAVCYSLGITNADPIGGKLLFERFLSEGRNTWPDIDLDLPSGERRERIIQEVYRRFAPYGAAMTANVITYRGRSAFREMGKVLGVTADIISRFSDLYANGDFPHTLKLKDLLKQSGLPQNHPRLPSLLRLYQSVYGLPRHLGQHSGGMVLCTHGLDGIVPLEPAAMPGRVVVQWDKDDCEDLGIIKVDLLGLGMMAVIEETLTTCKARGETREIELHRIPHDDAPTYEMMQRADTIGVFQIESRAQMATLPLMKPVCFYDVVIETAIIRPGPIVGDLVHPYLNRRSKKEPVDYIHESLKDCLERTLGVPLFQEQVLRIAMVMAGFSGSEAEELRRALSFHRSEDRMNKVLAKLRQAMELRNVATSIQDRIVGSIASFALYGFPESHAISFALLAYASAWLKLHRAGEFYAALLNNQPMGFYSPATLIQDAKRHGLKFKPVCVVHSALCCEVENDETIRLGLNQLRGVSRHRMEDLWRQRLQAPWSSLNDLLRRCPMNKKERRLLAQSGALNQLGWHRRSALWQVEEELQDDLFSRIAEETQTPLLPMTPMERLESDYHSQRFTAGGHPMKHLRESMGHVWRADELIKGRDGQWLSIAGLVICRQRPGTAKGHVFISLEDETGIANAFVPSTTFEANRLMITQEPFLEIQGRLQIHENVVSVYAQRIKPLRFPSHLGTASYDFH